MVAVFVTLVLPPEMTNDQPSGVATEKVSRAMAEIGMLDVEVVGSELQLDTTKRRASRSPGSLLTDRSGAKSVLTFTVHTEGAPVVKSALPHVVGAIDTTRKSGLSADVGESVVVTFALKVIASRR
jgi:hypothetical protein